MRNLGKSVLVLLALSSALMAGSASANGFGDPYSDNWYSRIYFYADRMHKASETVIDEAMYYNLYEVEEKALNLWEALNQYKAMSEGYQPGDPYKYQTKDYFLSKVRYAYLQLRHVTINNGYEYEQYPRLRTALISLKFSYIKLFRCTSYGDADTYGLDDDADLPIGG